jgi:hypothetical protein
MVTGCGWLANACKQMIIYYLLFIIITIIVIVIIAYVYVRHVHIRRSRGIVVVRGVVQTAAKSYTTNTYTANFTYYNVTLTLCIFSFFFFLKSFAAAK